MFPRYDSQNPGLRRNVGRKILTSESASQLRLNIQTASDIVTRLLLNTCTATRLLPAQTVLADLSNADGSTGPLMLATAPFLLMNVDSVAARMGPVYVPVALARRLLQSPENTVVWQTPITTAADLEQSLTQLWDELPFDFYVTVNTAVDFFVGDSNCDTGTGYSIITSLLHEAVHGMGIYSLIHNDRGGGLGGHVSLFDALIQKNITCAATDWACFLLDSTRVHYISGKQIAGVPTWLWQSQLYNPDQFDPGTSLCHFQSHNSVMTFDLSPQTCRFNFTATDVSALVHVGWACQLPQTFLSWNTSGLISALHVADTSERSDLPAVLVMGTLVVMVICALYFCVCGISSPECIQTKDSPGPLCHRCTTREHSSVRFTII